MQPDPDTWNALFDQMKSLRRLAPWRWLSETQVFGVHDPDSDTVGYVSVLGEGGIVTGLTVHAGAVGWSLLARMLKRDMDPFDGPYMQDAITAFLYDRKDLRPECYALLRSLRRSYRGRGAWPEVSRHRPGLVPVLPDASDAKFLAHVLSEALGVVERARDEPHLIVPGGQLLIRRAGRDTRQKRARPSPEPLLAPLDPVTTKRLSRMTRAERFWLGDHFLLPAPIDDGKGPAYFPRVHLWLEGDRGTVIDMDMTERDGGDDRLRERFVELAGQRGVPEHVVLRRASAAGAFRGLDPHIQVIHDPDAEPFYDVRDSLLQFNARG